MAILILLAFLWPTFIQIILIILRIAKKISMPIWLSSLLMLALNIAITKLFLNQHMQHVSPKPPQHGPPDVGLVYYILGIIGIVPLGFMFVIGGLAWYIHNRTPKTSIINTKVNPHYGLLKQSYNHNTKNRIVIHKP
jgi:hypothetical protein